MLFGRNLMIGIALLTCAMAAGAADDGAAQLFGTWAFMGKDNTGVDWKGTFTVEKLDTERFNAEKYTHMCDVQAQSKASGKGVGAPCKYDGATRTLSFSTGVDTMHAYQAVLSADGASLQGKWTESDKKTGATKLSGQWSARKPAK